MKWLLDNFDMCSFDLWIDSPPKYTSIGFDDGMTFSHIDLMENKKLSAKHVPEGNEFGDLYLLSLCLVIMFSNF